jgi:ABC-type phosphate transport system permease subunit
MKNFLLKTFALPLLIFAVALQAHSENLQTFCFAIATLLFILLFFFHLFNSKL